MTNWDLAPAAKQLLAEVNFLWPNRSKRSDGTIGDAAHASRTSHHNPDADGSVNAIDITHHPGVFDAHRFVRWLVTRNDSRVIEVISNREIWTRARAREGWRRYRGSNPHTAHAHISFSHTPALENSTTTYNIGEFFNRTVTALATPAAPEEHPMTDTYLRVTEAPTRPGDLADGAILADNGITLTWLDPEDWVLVQFLHALANKTPTLQDVNQAFARHLQRRRLDAVALNGAAMAVLAELAKPATTGAAVSAAAVVDELHRRLAS